MIYVSVSAVLARAHRNHCSSNRAEGCGVCSALRAISWYGSPRLSLSRSSRPLLGARGPTAAMSTLLNATAWRASAMKRSRNQRMLPESREGCGRAMGWCGNAHRQSQTSGRQSVWRHTRNLALCSPSFLLSWQKSSYLKKCNGTKREQMWAGCKQMCAMDEACARRCGTRCGVRARVCHTHLPPVNERDRRCTAPLTSGLRPCQQGSREYRSTRQGKRPRNVDMLQG